MKKLISIVIVGLFSAVFISEDVLSQDSPTVSNRQIDEIIVTSRKTEENIQDVPVAVYAVDEKALDDFRPTTMRDLVSMASILPQETKVLFSLGVVVMLKLKKHKTHL